MYAPALPSPAPWPPDDTEESVLGTHLHQTTITNLRTGFNEAARAAPGAPLPWQAGGQTLITGFRRRDGSHLNLLPDVFVYRVPVDPRRPSLSLRRDGAPLLVVEVLSEATAESDLDLEGGKGYSYAQAGVGEYLLLDPAGDQLPGDARGQGWRLVGGVYVPWAPDEQGRWASEQVGVAVGVEGIWAVVYGPDGRAIPREGEVLEGLARSRAAGLSEGLERGRAVGARALLRRVLVGRFGPLPPTLVERLEALEDPERLEALAEVALTAATVEQVAAALD